MLPRRPAPPRALGAILLATLAGCADEPPATAPPAGRGPDRAAQPAADSAETPARNGPDPAGASAPVDRAPGAAWEGPWLPEGLAGELPPWRPGAGDLPDRAAERGLDYRNVSGGPAKPVILEANGAGVAVLDLGADGDEDLVFSQGDESLAALLEGPGADLEVFLNDGEGRFERGPSPGLGGWWTGLAAGDVDGDGDDDLVAGAYGDLVLCLQDADGVLRPARENGLLPPDAAETGARLVPGAEREPGRPPLWATSLALLDADRDGMLDLYVGQYLELDPLRPPIGELGEPPLSIPCAWKGRQVYCGPRGLTPQPDRILRGAGDGTFTDVTSRWLPGIEAGYTLAVAPFDADGDGDTDLYVANDSSANLLLVNRVREEPGGFEDAGPFSGVSFGSDGQAEAGMGVAFGDVDRDGRLDFSVTNFSDEPTHLYRGATRGFESLTHRMGLGSASSRLLSWSTHLEDFDGDGWLELFTANGHVYPQADEATTGTRYAQPDTLWHLLPGDRVERVAPVVRESVLALERGTRGSAVADLDRSGTPDLVLAHLDAPASLALNDWGGARLWVRCLGPDRLAEGDGPRTPRDGRGARVVVVARDGRGVESGFLGEAQTAEGYQSSSTPWIHFGLGAAERYETIVVRWPSGARDELPAGPVDRRLWIREGEGVIRSEAFR